MIFLSIERWKTKEHVSSDCEYTEVACVYESLVCEVRRLREDRTTHENEDRGMIWNCLWLMLGYY